MWHCGGRATATMPRRATPHPSRRQLVDLVPKANPFPKGFLFSSFSCCLWLGPGWLGGCSQAGFWVQQGVLILLGCCSSTTRIQPCPQEQSSKAMAWQDLAGPGAASGDEAALAPTWPLWSDEEGNDGRGERGPGGPACPGAGEGGSAGTVQAGRGREEEAVCSPGGQYSGSSCHGNCAAVPDAANFEVHPGWNQPKNNNKALWVLRWICRIAIASRRCVHPCCCHAPSTWQPSWTFMGPYKWV